MSLSFMGFGGGLAGVGRDEEANEADEEDEVGRHEVDEADEAALVLRLAYIMGGASEYEVLWTGGYVGRAAAQGGAGEEVRWLICEIRLNVGLASERRCQVQWCTQALLKVRSSSYLVARGPLTGEEAKVLVVHLARTIQHTT